MWPSSWIRHIANASGVNIYFRAQKRSFIGSASLFVSQGALNDFFLWSQFTTLLRGLVWPMQWLWQFTAYASSLVCLSAESLIQVPSRFWFKTKCNKLWCFVLLLLRKPDGIPTVKAFIPAMANTYSGKKFWVLHKQNQIFTCVNIICVRWNKQHQMTANCCTRNAWSCYTAGRVFDPHQITNSWSKVLMP